MKKGLAILVLFIFSFFKAQNPIDFDDVKSKVQDSTGQYFYEKLVYKFGYLPTTLDSIESKYLYYGQSYKIKAKEKRIIPVGDFMEKKRRKQYKEAIEEGEKILKEDPVSLEIIGALIQLYEKSDKENPLFPLRINQFRVLVNAIIHNVEEKNDDKIYTVMSVVDEYIIGGVLDYNLYTMRRKSERTSNGIIDYWKSGKKRISFLVHYPKE
ncbi:DUF4919 domain-containing protein [Chryseobacterium daecheongense]|uniref:DUF4919 domain-containing protein n=1 Tax=Chryseobacterium daecheongense TaxID=192389 RepID=UPI001FD648FB|nr:DUF4919 domain-containing protein [Chryseobacterium daecheongense]UOU98740.1 DUF4919 domain-containing protein [Chryseobacterium daecheongense]